MRLGEITERFTARARVPCAGFALNTWMTALPNPLPTRRPAKSAYHQRRRVRIASRHAVAMIGL